MSTPNTLSYLIQFKTDIAVLDKTVAWLEKAQRRVQEYNATMQNGAAAVNTALQAAAGLFAVNALKGYVDEAVKMRQAQGQLDQALRRTGQYSAEYSKQLAAQADAAETLTGIDSTRIAAVQRELVLAGVKKQDLAELTGLTLDYAAAREVEAGAAAKLVGQTLRGEADSVRGLGIELDLSKGRIEAVKEAFGRFRGQAEESTNSLPKGMRDFAKASDDAKKAAGNLVIEISTPALEGFAKGLKTTEESLKAMTGTGNATVDMIKSLAGTLGGFVGRNLNTIIALAAGFLGVKAAIYAVNQASVLLGSTWVMLTGQQFLPMMASIQGLSREFGVLKSATLSWQGTLGTGMLMAADFAVFYQLGKALGALPWKAIEEQESQIYNEVNGVTDAYLNQWDKVKSLSEAEALRMKQAEQYKKTQEEIAALEGAKKVSETKSTKPYGTNFRGNMDYIPAGTPKGGFEHTDQLRLNYLKTQAEVMGVVTTATSDPKWIAQKVEANKPKAERDAELQRADLVRKKELIGLENQLTAAQAARNQPEIDRLQRLIEEKKLNEDWKQFGTEAAALVQSRLQAEDQARTKARKEQEDAFALATEQQLAELQANRAEQDRLALLEMEKKLRIELQALGAGGEPLIQQRLAAEKARLDRESALAVLKAKSTVAESDLAHAEAQRGAITGNTLLDENTKRLRLAQNTEEYRKVLAQVLELKLQERKLAVDKAEQASLDAEIKSLTDRGATYGASDLPVSRANRASLDYQNRANPTDHYQTAGAGMMGGAQDFVTSLGTAADSAAAAVTGTLNTALSSTSDLLYNVISGATSMKDAWGQATLAIGRQFLRMITDMVAKMIWRNTVERALTALGVTTHGAGEAAKTTATTTGGGIRLLVTIKEALASVYHGAVAAFEAMASIPYVGPFVAAAAMAAALAGGISLVSKISHADGGLITGAGGPRDDRIPALLSNGEYVIPAHRVQQYGAGFFEAIRSGSYLADNASAALASRGAALQSFGPAGASMPAASAGGGEAPNVHVNFGAFNNQQHAQSWLETQQGEKYMVNFLKRRGFSNG